VYINLADYFSPVLNNIHFYFQRMEISQQWPQPKCFIEFSDFSALPSCQNASTDDSTTTTFGRGKDLMINTRAIAINGSGKWLPVSFVRF